MSKHYKKSSKILFFNGITKISEVYLLKKYPYIIFFQVDENRKLISINAVFQGNQDIDKRP